MADSDSIYGRTSSSGHLGGHAQPSAPRPKESRVHFFFRTGGVASYPYHHVSLIEAADAGSITIHCTCGKLDRITIKGANLVPVITGLLTQTLSECRESDARLAPKDKPWVESITFKHR